MPIPSNFSQMLFSKDGRRIITKYIVAEVIKVAPWHLGRIVRGLEVGLNVDKEGEYSIRFGLPLNMPIPKIKDARAQEYGSGLYAKYGQKRKIIIKPRRRKALAFFWNTTSAGVKVDVNALWRGKVSSAGTGGNVPKFKGYLKQLQVRTKVRETSLGSKLPEQRRSGRDRFHYTPTVDSAGKVVKKNYKLWSVKSTAKLVRTKRSINSATGKEIDTTHLAFNWVEHPGIKPANDGKGYLRLGFRNALPQLKHGAFLASSADVKIRISRSFADVSKKKIYNYVSLITNAFGVEGLTKIWIKDWK